MRVALYGRVSTTNGQSTENQLRELRKVAKRTGWDVVAEFTDDGISGGKGRDKRPGFDALLKAATRREVDVVAAWSVTDGCWEKANYPAKPEVLRSARREFNR